MAQLRIRELRRPLVRQLDVRGARMVIRLEPEGRIAAKGKLGRRWYSIDLAELFPHVLAAKGVASVEQLRLGSFAPAARPVPKEGSPR